MTFKPVGLHPSVHARLAKLAGSLSVGDVVALLLDLVPEDELREAIAVRELGWRRWQEDISSQVAEARATAPGAGSGTE